MHEVGDGGDRAPLRNGALAHQGAGRQQQDRAHLPARDARQELRAEDGGDAPAAAAAGVDVLRFGGIEQDTAVGEDVRKLCFLRVGNVMSMTEDDHEFFYVIYTH